MGTRPLQLDIACGRKKREGFTGIDIAPLPGVDIVHDLEVFPWPIDDECVELVNVSHYIEHTKDLMQFMNELYRIMKAGRRSDGDGAVLQLDSCLAGSDAHSGDLRSNVLLFQCRMAEEQGT